MEAGMTQSDPAPIANDGVSVVVPCFNEQGAVKQTIEQIRLALESLSMPWEMVFVNDGSKDGTASVLDDIEQSSPWFRVVHNPRNLGYGASLKRGISQARYARIVITDADGTYPNERIPELVQLLDESDMAIGARVGKNIKVPLVRRPAKWVLLHYARALTGADIKDVNSGLRAFWVHHARNVWSMLPNTFSFTSTITIAMHIQNLDVRYVPIAYHARVGQSSIRPIRDTLRFFSLILRTVMYFKPLPVFGAFALVLMLSALTVGVLSKLLTGILADVTVTSLFSTGIVFLGLGLIGDLINARR